MPSHLHQVLQQYLYGVFFEEQQYRVVQDVVNQQ